MDHVSDVSGEIVVFSSNLDDHLFHVRDVFRVLRDAGITLKVKNYEFVTEWVKYLEHINRPGKLSIDEVRVKSLKDAKDPAKKTELRSFLGLPNLYRRFFPNFEDNAAPLNKLHTKR